MEALSTDQPHLNTLGNSLKIKTFSSKAENSTGSSIRENGVTSLTKWLVSALPSILTSKQVFPRVAPKVALAPAHMRPKPSCEIACAEQKSSVLI